METTLRKVLQQTNTPPPKQKSSHWLIQFWETWGIWLVIISCMLVLFLFTDFGGFMRGVRDGYTEAGQKDTPSVIGMLIGGTLGILVVIGDYCGAFLMCITPCSIGMSSKTISWHTRCCT